MSFLNMIRIPELRLHKGKNRMYIAYLGDFRYFGKPDDPATVQRYNDFVAEWKRTGCMPAKKSANPAPAPGTAQGFTVGDVLHRYRDHPENQPLHPYMKAAIRELEDYCGTFPAAALTPKVLKNFMESMATRMDVQPDETERPHFSHTTIRQVLQCIKRMYKWAGAEELVEASAWMGLTAVSTPRVSRSTARAPRKVLPVSDAVIKKTLEKLPATLAAVVQLLNLTGARPTELLMLKAGQIDRSAAADDDNEGPAVWRAVLTEHKNAHRGQERVIYFGPAAQIILAPYLLRPADEYLFKPMAAFKEAFAGCEGRHQPVKEPKTARRMGEHFNVCALRHAIKRACVKAEVEPWFPYQLRHGAATRARAAAGLDGAQAMLGHAHASITEVYAELDADKARALALRIG